jgi:Cof subfamily protein (haloacid dehalogenase superfamily)
MKMKGWIALDIDGTITLDKYSVPEPVIDALRQFKQQGWNLAFVTGRSFSFAEMALSRFDFPYVLLSQNGSFACEMPSRTHLFKKYISPHHIPLVEEVYSDIDSDFLIYAGYEKGDFCYWRPSFFSREELTYLTDLQKRQKETWKSVESFSVVDDFPLIKCFGDEAKMDLIQARLQRLEKFQVAKIRDPFVEGHYLLLVTDIAASKGAALTKLFQMKGRGSHVISAGDDENDFSLLSVADTKIAMHHAPKSLQAVATFIAPPTKDYGIIAALQMAVRNVDG